MRVFSTNIKEIWYNPQKKILAVRFRRETNKLYNYIGVPKNIWTDLIKSKSKGMYFEQCIKMSYRYKKRNFNFSSNNEGLFF